MQRRQAMQLAVLTLPLSAQQYYDELGAALEKFAERYNLMAKELTANKFPIMEHAPALDKLWANVQQSEGWPKTKKKKDC